MTTYYLRYAAWEDMPADFRLAVWGNDDWVREFYTHYTVWAGTVHEMAHILRWHYGTDTGSADPWAEETAANAFAVAYWRARGEEGRLASCASLVRRALSTITDPVPLGEDPAVFYRDPVGYFQQHYHDPLPFLTYGYFQEQMLLAAVEQRRDLYTVLRMSITPTVCAAEPARPAPYPTVDADLPFRIVEDMRPFLAPYGIELPTVRVVRGFSPGSQPVAREEP
jgi:hypothetical protein